MKTSATLAIILLVGSVLAQNSPFRRMGIITTLDRPPRTQSAQLKDLQTFDNWGITYTADAIFRTTDAGATWSELPLKIGVSETLSVVRFSDRTNGYAFVSSANVMTMFRTHDGGETWEKIAI